MIDIRIDKFLKNSRIIKRRSLAKEACEQDRVSINNKISKPADKVKSGDIVEITFGDSLVKLEVLQLKDSAQKKDADKMYKIL